MKLMVFMECTKMFFNRVVCFVSGVVVVALLIADAWNDRHRLTSLGGFFVIIIFMFLFSTNPAKVCKLLCRGVRRVHG